VRNGSGKFDGRDLIVLRMRVCDNKPKLNRGTAAEVDAVGEFLVGSLLGSNHGDWKDLFTWFFFPNSLFGKLKWQGCRGFSGRKLLCFYFFKMSESAASSSLNFSLCMCCEFFFSAEYSNTSL